MTNKKKGKLFTLLIPVLAIILLLGKSYILALVPYFPSCSVYKALGLYCPACGNTRSVVALLHGDVFTSLRYNIMPLLLIFLALLGYIELVTYSFYRHVRLLPRSLVFYLILIALMVIYWIGRNFSPFLTP